MSGQLKSGHRTKSGGWGDWQDFGAVLRERREQAGLSLRELAEKILWNFSLIGKWERGRNRPPAQAIIALDAALDAGGDLVTWALHAAMADTDRLRMGSTKTGFADGDKDGEMERRRLLGLAAGMGVLGAFGEHEPVRQLLDLAVDHRTAEDWEIACADHLHAIRTRPAEQVAGDLLADLLGLQRQLAMATGAEAIELHRVAAVLGAYEGSILTRLGQPGAALRWYGTARKAADASGDLDLRVMIRAHEAGHSLYGLRDPATVLRLTEIAQRIAGSRPSVGLTLITRVQANALALLGRHDEALGALHDFLDLSTNSLPEVPGFWEASDYRLQVSECQVHAAAGREREVDRAATAILAGAPHGGYQVPVYARIYLAQCAVVKGGVDHGVRQAAAALDSLPKPYRNVMVTESARRVLRAVPADQQQRPAVAELRQLAIEA